MKIKNIQFLSLLFAILIFEISCKKQDDFLNAKPNQSLSAISTLSDCQSLLLNEGQFNIYDPCLGELSSDDFYETYNYWNARATTEHNSYIWAQQVFAAGANDNDWTMPYLSIYIANTVLDALPKINYASNQQVLFNQTEGTALFFRAYNFYNLVQTFAMPYDSATASTQLGIPLRLTSDLNDPITRASEKDCYSQIITDLKTAINLLPVVTSIPTLPNQAAANGLLARIYLAIGDYAKAYSYSDAYLAAYNQLVDYNTLSPGPSSLITNGFLSEDIFHSRLCSYVSIVPGPNRTIVDSVLYQSYAANDLRQSLFFGLQNGLPYFKGTYDRFGFYEYSGIATDEMYLIRAECNARSGNVTNAMNDLNTLLITRWKKVGGVSTFVPYTAINADDALRQILMERRKELIFRGLRWTDLRRLNKDSRFAITLTRILNGTTYTLPPNDPKYALPIPDNEIAVSHIQQNPR